MNDLIQEALAQPHNADRKGELEGLGVAAQHGWVKTRYEHKTDIAGRLRVFENLDRLREILMSDERRQRLVRSLCLLFPPP